MRSLSPRRAIYSTTTSRKVLRTDEESYASILTDIAKALYPPPKTAMQIAVAVGCGERNIELCLAGKQNWSGDAVAVFVAEILKRHHMRNFKVAPR